MTRFQQPVLLTAIVWIAALGIASAAVTGDAPAAGRSFASAKLSSCRLPGVAQPVRCGALDLPENPERPRGRQLPINIVVIPATGARALPDPIAVLMGGPGEDAISAAASLTDQFAALRKDRDILLVDQRGTGRSRALRCDLFSAQEPAASLRDVFPLSAVERCERLLSARADLTQYTYVRFADDLEHIRRALGYGPLNLFAGSYGTRAAQVYLRRYPQSVRTAYLGSVVPIDVAIPLPFAKTEQAALGSLIDACAADSVCRSAFPNLRDEFRQVAARLESGVVRVSTPDHAGTVPIYRGRVAEWFRAKLYRPTSAAILPLIIHRAYLGDWTALVEGILSDAREADSALSFGLFFSITCNEDVAFIRAEDIARESQGTFLGDYRVRQQQAACKNWPKASPPENYRKPVHSAVPTLFVSGDADGGTPLWFMQHAAQGFSDRLEVVLHGQGHTEWNDCIARVYQRLLSSGSTRGFSVSACEPVPRPAFKTR